MTNLVVCQRGDVEYDELLDPVRDDRELLARMLDDAESELDEQDGKTWVIAAVHAGGRRVAGAWAAATVVEDEGRPTLKCVNSYEVPRWRGHGLYAAAYAKRHEVIVKPSPLPALTYIFAQPLALHLADGWVITRQSEPGKDRHHWYELRRPNRLIGVHRD